MTQIRIVRYSLALFFSLLLCAAPLQAETIYYCKGGSVADALSNWSTSRDGSGSQPVAFSDNYNTYVIQNGQSISNSAFWDISGYNAKIIIEDGGTLTAAFIIHVNNFEIQGHGIYIHSAVSAQSNGSLTDFPGDYNRLFADSSSVIVHKWANGGSEPIALPGGLGKLTIDVDNLGGNWNCAVFYGGPLQGDLVINQTGGSSYEFILGQGYVNGNLIVNGGILNLSNSAVAGTDYVFIGGSIRHNGGTIKVGGPDRIVDLSIGGNVDTSYFYSVGTSLLNSKINYTTYSGCRFILLSNLPVAASRQFRASGIIDCGLFALTGEGNAGFDGRIFIGSPNGITASGSSGNIQVSGERIYYPGSVFIYNGSSAQYTGNGLPVPADTVIINNSNGVTLSGNVSIGKRLILQQGNLYTGSNTLTLNDKASMTGEIAGRSVIGTVVADLRIFGNVGNQLGNIGVELDPYNVVFALSVERTSGTAGIVSANGNEGIARKWKFSTAPHGGPTSDVTVTFGWTSDDDNGKSLGSMRVWKSSDDGTTWFPIGAVQNASGTRQVSVTVNSFSQFTVSDESSPLPVTLTSFEIYPQKNGALLCWNTATELNNYGFEVERTASGSAQWAKIGFVAGNGTSNSSKEYSYTDSKLAAGRYAYRLKQIDLDASFDYSKKVEVEIGSMPGIFELSQNFPNPFNPATTIRYGLPFTANVKLVILNALGQELTILKNGEQEAGYHEVGWSAAMSSGIYFCRIEAASLNDPGKRFIETKRMLLLK